MSSASLSELCRSWIQNLRAHPDRPLTAGEVAGTLEVFIETVQGGYAITTAICQWCGVAGNVEILAYSNNTLKLRCMNKGCRGEFTERV